MLFVKTLSFFSYELQILMRITDKLQIRQGGLKSISELTFYINLLLLVLPYYIL